MSANGLPRVQYDALQLKGGLDQITPTLALAPGAVKDAANFECSVTGGYTRIAGYERFDGRAAPSSASYTVVFFGLFANTPTIGSTLVSSSGGSGLVIGVGSDHVAITSNTGSFNAGDTCTFGGGTNAGAVQASGTLSARQSAVYQAAASDVLRALINPVPGSGNVLGVAVFNSDVYAWRNNAGGTAAVMHKATTGGWSAVSLGYEVAFSNANTSVGEGDTLTQGGVTATINRVVVETGTLLSGTNTGRLIISTPSGGAFAAGAATSTGGGSLTLSGASSAITLQPGGRYETLIGNFTGSASTKRLYGCDGVNRAFEFDGSIYVPINSGITPKHIAIHRNHLFLSKYSSVIHSAIGAPYNYSVTAGAGEIAVGDEVTGMLNQPGSQTSDALGIYGRSNTFILYGTSASSWSLTMFNRGVGGVHYTAQNLAQSYVLDDRGVVTMATSLNYGNFDSATLSAAIRPFILERQGKATSSSVSREKSQYRVFFNDGSGLYFTIVNGSFSGAMPVSFPVPVLCSANDEDSFGREVTYFGSSNGYVYKLDSGTSFDGGAIDSRLVLNYNATKSPRILKRYRKCGLEITGDSYAEIGFSYKLGYNSSEYAQPGQTTYRTPFAVPYWDSTYWDFFSWDGSTLLPTECEMSGTAENCALSIVSSTNYSRSFTINSAIIHYSLRRGIR